MINLGELNEQISRRMDYARRLVKHRPAHTFIRHTGHYTCDFAGHLLASVVTYGVTRRPYKSAIVIQDADDTRLEIPLLTQERALEVFKELFDGNPLFDSDLIDRINSYGVFEENSF